MPPGSLIPKDIRKKLGVFEKFAPKEVLEQLRILSEAERSFVIPVKVPDNGKDKYLIIAGMLLSEKVPVSVSYDETDLQLLAYSLEKAKNALAHKVNKQEEPQNKEEIDDGQ